MKRLQYLTASHQIIERGAHSRAQDKPTITAKFNAGKLEIQNKIDAMSCEQLIELRNFTYKKLCRERRLCSAGSKNYNINDHIRLYLRHKQLAQNS